MTALWPGVVLRQCPEVPLSVHYGSFLASKVRMPLVHPVPGHHSALVIKMEEKGSDHWPTALWFYLPFSRVRIMLCRYLT